MISRFTTYKYLLLTLVIFQLSAVSLFAQQPSYFILGKAQFEGVQIYDVIQDNDLNYWFATDEGIYKYDGYTYSNITCTGLTGSSVFGFVKNANGIIFCHNLNNQIIKIQNSKCSILYELKENESSPDIYLTITAEDCLLIITNTALLFDPSGKKIEIQKISNNYYSFPFLTQKGKIICHITGTNSVLEFESGKFKISPFYNDSDTMHGVLKFFRISEKTYAINVSSKNIYSFDETNYRLEFLSKNAFNNNDEYFRFYNENNQLWIAGTLSGVRLLNDPASNQQLELIYPQYFISDIFKDNEGNILLSTFNNGVLVIPNLKIPDVLPLPELQSIVSIHYDQDIGMLMGTIKGKLLAFKNNKLRSICNEGTRPIQSIYSWPGFPYILFDDGNIKAYNKITEVIIPLTQGSLKDAALVGESTLYLALNTGVSKIILDEKGVLTEENINSLKIRCYSLGIEPKSKNVYIATADGLKRLESNGSISNVKYKGESIFANDIAGDNQTLYISTKNQGILLFKKDSFIQQIIPKINQREVEVLKLIVSNNKIYANSSEGFVAFGMYGSVLMQLDKVYGFSTNKIYDFELVNNQLWISHSNGIQQLNLSELNSKINKPLIRIANIDVNGKSILNTSINGQYESDERRFHFKVSSPTLRNKENIRYHYILRGYDETWLIANYNGNEIVYNALAPGNYTFIVKAENQGVFSEPVSYSFSILSPFYTRWWFIVFLGIVILSCIILIYRRQLKTQNKKAQMVNELNLSRLTAIQSQMNPHFIFNSLNSIQDLVLKGDIDNSYTFITKFSNLIRRTLNYSDKDFIEFEQELKLIELYLSLEKLRFKDELNYIIDSASIEDILVPPMLIQPFIENALIHGLLHKEGKKQITIRFQLNETLTCTIEDNGVGREKAKEIQARQRSEHESFSGQAIKKRFSILSEHFKGELGFHYEDLYENNVPTGTRVTLYIPVKRKF